MNRRTVLAGAGSVGLSSLAGCTTRGYGDSGYVRPDDDPDSVPGALACETESFERYRAGYDESRIAWGSAGDFTLRVNDLSFAYGDTVEVTLRATSVLGGETIVQSQYNIELYTQDGWQDVRGWVDGQPLPLPDITERHLPRGGFTWEFEFSEQGFLANHPHESELTVCPDLLPGRYRFVYTGLSDTDDAVAVAFDLKHPS